MDETRLQQQIDDINKKLDTILDEVAAQRRVRQGIEDLQDDVMRAGSDALKSAITELEELTDNLATEDFMLLGKKLLRNVNNIKTAFEQLESARDFISDFTSISGDMFNNVLLKLDDLDRKGYFRLLRETEHTLDAIVASFSVDDLKRMNETIPMVIDIIKRLSNPELLGQIDTATAVLEQYPFEPGKKPSTVRLLREMTRPEVRQGLVYMTGLYNTIIAELKKKENSHG